MQDHSRYMQDFARGGNFCFIWVRSVSLHSCAWCSVPPHLGRTSYRCASRCYRYGGYAAPYAPSIRPLDTNSLQKNSGTTFGGLGFSFYICPKQI